MKHIKQVIVYVNIVLFFGLQGGQLVSATKILYILENQNYSTIQNELKSFGFSYKGKYPINAIIP